MDVQRPIGNGKLKIGRLVLYLERGVGNAQPPDENRRSPPGITRVFGFVSTQRQVEFSRSIPPNGETQAPNLGVGNHEASPENTPRIDTHLQGTGPEERGSVLRLRETGGDTLGGKGKPQQIVVEFGDFQIDALGFAQDLTDCSEKIALCRRGMYRQDGTRQAQKPETDD